MNENMNQLNNNISQNNQINNNSTKNSSKKIFLLILLLAILAAIYFITTKINNKNVTNNENNGNYVSINIVDPDLAYEAPYIEKTIRTFFYDDNRKITRIVFTDVYSNSSYALKDYNLMNTSVTAQYNFNEKYLVIKNNVITYEYDDDVLENYYSNLTDYDTIDELIEVYGEENIVKDFFPNINDVNSITDKTNNSTNNNQSNNEKSKYELMAKQVEEKLSANATKYYLQMAKVNSKYYATVDVDSIKYTDEYSNTGDYYYVMEGLVKNSSTGLLAARYYARCKWNDNTKTIENYGDNTKILIALNVYEQAYRGFFTISKDQYKTDIAWDTSDVVGKNFYDILTSFEVDYFYYDNSITKNETSFNTMKSTQIDRIKKAMKAKAVNIYLAQILVEDETPDFSIANYFNYKFALGETENINSAINYFKNQELYYEEKIELQ